MTDKNLFEFVKGLLKTPPDSAKKPIPRPTAGRTELPVTSKPPDSDSQNPATITRIGKSNDGRELIMTLAFGTFLVDRETPTIGYYNHGAVAEVPTVELQNLLDALQSKRNVGPFALHYVDLLNVVTHELEVRAQRRGSATPVAPPPRPAVTPRPQPAPSAGADAENPATIVRVGRSHHGAELIMTLGLGTFIVHREAPNLRYFDRGREWDVPDMELQVLVDSLMAKETMEEHRYAYIDLLNVASFMVERRRAAGRRRWAAGGATLNPLPKRGKVGMRGDITPASPRGNSRDRRRHAALAQFFIHRPERGLCPV